MTETEVTLPQLAKRAADDEATENIMPIADQLMANNGNSQKSMDGIENENFEAPLKKAKLTRDEKEDDNGEDHVCILLFCFR